MHDAGDFIPSYAEQGGGRKYLLRHAKCAGEVLVPNRQHERAVVVLVYGTVGHDINQKR